MDNPTEKAHTVIASLALDKGSIRLRKLKDNSNEYTLPCHAETIVTMKLVEDDKDIILATHCEGGQYIRIWCWPENSITGEMDPPQSLYMF